MEVTASYMTTFLQQLSLCYEFCYLDSSGIRPGNVPIGYRDEIDYNLHVLAGKPIAVLKIYMLNTNKHFWGGENQLA